MSYYTTDNCKMYLAELVRAAPTPAHGLKLARKYLQARILSALQRVGAMILLDIHGGTALRFLYSSPRYSEDLDFVLERAGERYDFRACLGAIRSEFQAEGYAVTLKVSDQKTVHSAFLRFPGLPYKLRLSPHREEVLAVKFSGWTGDGWRMMCAPSWGAAPIWIYSPWRTCWRPGENWWQAMTDTFSHNYALLIGGGPSCGGAGLRAYPDDMASNHPVLRSLPRLDVGLSGPGFLQKNRL